MKENFWTMYLTAMGATYLQKGGNTRVNGKKGKEKVLDGMSSKMIKDGTRGSGKTTKEKGGGSNGSTKGDMRVSGSKIGNMVGDV